MPEDHPGRSRASTGLQNDLGSTASAIPLICPKSFANPFAPVEDRHAQVPYG